MRRNRKVIRLTESDLVKLVKRVISEQAIEEDKNKVLKTFLNSIQRSGTRDKSRWVLDNNNPNRRRGGDFKLTGKEFPMLKSYVNKPLTWSLEVDGIKEEGAVFQIFSNKDGELYYQVYSSVKPGVKNTKGYEKLTMDTVGEAIKRFNQRLIM